MSLSYSHPQPALVVSRTAGIAFLLTAKGMDLATTAAVVTALPRAEANPFAATVLDWFGLIGLVAVAVLVVALVVAVTELAVRITRDEYPVRGPIAIRLLGYGPLTVLWALVAIRNIRQISGVVA